MSALTIPVIPAMPAGSIATSQQLNDLVGCCEFLYQKPMTKVIDETGGTEIQEVGNFGYVSYSTALYDVDGQWSPTAPTVLTIQTPGWYKVRYSVTFTDGDSGGMSAAVRSLSGPNSPQGSGVVSLSYWGSSCLCESGMVNAIGSSGLWPFYLYTGDQLRVLVYSSQTGNTTLGSAQYGSFFSTEYVSIQY
jgi:hypothetical protein